MAIDRVLVTIALLLPWLNPVAPGPSPATVPWLVSLVAFGCLLLLASVRRFQGCVASKTKLAQRWAYFAAVAWLLAGVLSTVLALLQYFGNSGLFGPWVDHARLGEAFANLRQRNQFATLTNVALAALLWFVVGKQLVDRATGRLHWVAISIGCFLAAGNAASQSRTGIAQLGLFWILCAVWKLWRLAAVRNILLAAVITYTIAAFVLPVLAGFDLSTFGLFARLREGDQPCASRITLWSNVLHLIAQKPWLGWGWGELDYAHFITMYNGPRFCDILDNAHNLPLHLAVELGVPFSLLVCGGFTWWVVRQKPWAERDATRQMAWAVMAVILLHSMLEYPLWCGPFQMAFLICFGLLWQRKQPPDINNRTKKVSNWSLAPILIPPLAITLIVCSAYAAWDYHRISQIYLPPESRAPAYGTDTLNKIRGSWLFADQVQFAELMITPLTSANAVWTFNTARQLLHYSPEPRVIEKLIESAVLLGKDNDALFYLARFRTAFPDEQQRWAKSQLKAPLTPSPDTLKR
jgi:O-antigen ligase